jgi:hypothetical protein
VFAVVRRKKLAAVMGLMLLRKKSVYEALGVF